MLTKEPHLEGFLLPIRSCHSELRTGTGKLHVPCLIIPGNLSLFDLAFQLPGLRPFSSGIKNLIFVFTTVVPDIFIIPVQEKKPNLRQGIRQLKLGVYDIVHIKEGFQMLGTYGSNDPVFRMNDITDLLDIPYVSGSHFTNEDLMGGL